MKLEQFCPIFEQLIYLVNSWRVVKKHIKHQEDDDGESGGFIVVVMGKCIKCELAGVRSFSYSCFEALKAKDRRLEPVPHYSDNEKIRKNSNLSSS